MSGSRSTSKRRPPWLGLVLFLAGGALFGLLVIAGLAYWAYAKRDVLAEEAKDIVRDARAYARGHDQAQCVDEALRRRAKCFSLPCELRATLFVNECARKAQRAPAFCDDAPDPKNAFAVAAWSIKECAKRGYTVSDQSCARILQAAGRSCHGM